MTAPGSIRAPARSLISRKQAMADERDPPSIDPELAKFVREAIARGIPRVGESEPIDKPPAFTGRDAAGFNTRDAALIREIARQMVDERLRERQLLSEAEIKAVAREIAQAIAEKTVSGVKSDLRTEEQIKAIAETIVIDKLREVGIRADEAHIDETRDTLAGVQRIHKRRVELGRDFIRETVKGVAAYGSAAILGALGVYFAIKGAPH